MTNFSVFSTIFFIVKVELSVPENRTTREKLEQEWLIPAVVLFVPFAVTLALTVTTTFTHVTHQELAALQD